MNRRDFIRANRYPEFLASADRNVPWSKKQWTAPPQGPPPAAGGGPSAKKNRKPR